MTERKRSEIYTYESDNLVYAMNWSVSILPRYGAAVGMGVGAERHGKEGPDGPACLTEFVRSHARHTLDVAG